MIKIDSTLPEDVQVLIKASYHLTQKAVPIRSDEGEVIGYKVPKRELNRVRSKVGLLVEVS